MISSRVFTIIRVRRIFFTVFSSFSALCRPETFPFLRVGLKFLQLPKCFFPADVIQFARTFGESRSQTVKLSGEF